MNKIPDNAIYDFRETVLMDTRGPNFKAQPTAMKDFANTDEDPLFKRITSKVRAVGSDHPVLIVSADVSHMGYINDNFRYYMSDYGPASARTWTAPYPKPVLLEHRKSDSMFGGQASEPLGRVIKGTYVDFGVTGNKAKDLITRKGVQRVYSTISGTENIDKVMDGRYLTISISGNSKTIKCSVCGVDLKEESCEHELGDVYDKVVAYMIYDILSYHEWSYVLVPADTQAKNNRFELIGEPSDSKMISVYSQITKDIAPVKNRGKFNDANISIYFAQKNGAVFDMLPSNVNSKDIELILDKEDLFACYKDACHLIDVKDSKTVDKDNDNSNIPNNNEEDDSTMDVKDFTDLVKLPFVKEAMDKEIASKSKDILAENVTLKASVTTAEDKVKTLEEDGKTKDMRITQLEGDLKTYHENDKKDLVDTLYGLQLKTGHARVVAIDKMEPETKAKAEKDYKDELQKRENQSIKDAIEDLTKSVPQDDASDKDKDKNSITGKDTNQPPTPDINGDVADNGGKDKVVDKPSPVENLFN